MPQYPSSRQSLTSDWVARFRAGGCRVEVDRLAAFGGVVAGDDPRHRDRHQGRVAEVAQPVEERAPQRFDDDVQRLG